MSLREKQSKHKFRKRAGRYDKHHLTPKERKDCKNRYKKIRIDAYRHDAWHLLFGNLNLDEIIEVLQRLEKLTRKKE